MSRTMVKRRAGLGRQESRAPRVTLDQLRTFIAVAEKEHIGLAAASLHLSQGSVSTAVSRLESALGISLLLRVGRSVRLTDVGRAVRQLSVQVLGRVAEIEELSAGYQAFDRGHVTVAAGRVTGAHQLPGWLAPFVAEHPDVDVHISLASVGGVLALLRDGLADVAVVGAEVRLRNVETLVLERTELIVVVAAQHPLAIVGETERDLRAHRYLAHEQGSATRWRSDQIVRPSDYRSAMELEEGALQAALLAGIGFAVMPRSVVQPQLESGELVAIARPGRRVALRVSAARLRAVHTPAVEELWRHLRQLSVVTR